MEMANQMEAPPPRPPHQPSEAKNEGRDGWKASDWFGGTKPLPVFALFAVVLLLTVLSGVHRVSFLDRFLARLPEAEAGQKGSVDESLGGLLSLAFDEASCRSRFESASLLKPLNHTPSPYLLEKLRSYEALHRKCGPNTELYRESIRQLKSNRSGGGRQTECNYVVWMPQHGLGNRMISITSAFLYALLNDKVLLLFFPDYMNGLFCEPFPNTTWLLPSDFPITHISSSFDKDPNRYGDLLRHKILSNDMNVTNASIPLPAYLYLHLVHNNNDYDRLFYCEDGQLLLRQFPWLLLRSNQYFVPALFLVPMFEQELSLLFPERTAVFHLLGRYLFHPTNAVWGHVTRYYEAYLANAEEILGVQVRTFADVDPGKHSSYIMNCAISKNLLPSLDTGGGAAAAALSDTIRVKPKAVLVTSLKSEYFDRIRDTYYGNATATGEVIGVYQPSHEEKQFTEKLDHNVKALAEIYLLGLSDSLITSPYSTFGYVAQGLGGIRPWLLVRSHDENLCLQSSTMEPCFHFPPSFECKSRRKLDLGSVVPYLRHCEDKTGGIKLF